MKDYWEVLFFIGLSFVLGTICGASIIINGNKDDIINGFVECNDTVYRVIQVIPADPSTEEKEE